MYEKDPEEIQKQRDEHWDSSYQLDPFHRMNCPYCYKRMRGFPLPKIKVKLRNPNDEGFEIREIKDAADKN